MIKSPHLESSTLLKEGPLRASKWIDIPVLLDANEMNELFNELNSCSLFKTDRLVSEGAVSKEEFLANYKKYLDQLHNQEEVCVKWIKEQFTLSLTFDLKALYQIDIDHRKIIKCRLPVIRVQAHQFNYSHVDHKFRSMVFGNQSISWGLMFSYPQLFQDPLTHEVLKVFNNDNFQNTAFFQILRRWVRHHTLPTPFIVEEKCTNTPIRLGKNCFGWINSHPQLKKEGIFVKTV